MLKHNFFFFSLLHLADFCEKIKDEGRYTAICQARTHLVSFFNARKYPSVICGNIMKEPEISAVSEDVKPQLE